MQHDAINPNKPIKNKCIQELSWSQITELTMHAASFSAECNQQVKQSYSDFRSHVVALCSVFLGFHNHKYLSALVSGYTSTPS